MISREAEQLHSQSTVVDTHVDSLLAAVHGHRSLGDRSDSGHVDLPRLHEGGVDVQFFAHYIEPEYKPDRGLLRFMQIADVFYREMQCNSAHVGVVQSFADIQRFNDEGRIAAVMAVEGAEAMQGDLSVLRMLHRLGVRCIGLTWNQRNQLADGVGEMRTGGGLTTLGVKAVREMNRLGIIVDVSHLADPGFWDVAECTDAPFIATHSNARSVCDHPRNLTDEQIDALAECGGVMGMNFAPAFVHPERATLDRMLDHIDHIVARVGPAHVGLGSDFDGIGDTPQGLEDVTCMPRITEGLLHRGYSQSDIAAILGGNFLRVFREVWGE